MAVSLGEAVISISADGTQFRKGLGEELGTKSGPVAEKSGKTIGDRLGTALKRSAQATAVAVGGLLTASLVKGWGRLTGIENAQAKLKGLGHDAASVEKIMDNALASVKGTAFGLDEAATTAAGAVAAGIKPGEELERTLKSVANSAAAAGVDMNEMGSIFNKVASIGKAQNDVLMQVADRGIPIYEALADQMGVTADEVFKMASQGKIDFEMFESAMTQAAGTVADELGKTTTGSIANFWAALGRGGAAFLDGVFPKIAPAFQGLTGVIDDATPVIEAWGAKMGDAVQGIVDTFKDLRNSAGVQDTLDRLQGIFESLSGSAQRLVTPVKDIIGSLAQASAAIGISAWQLLLGVLEGAAVVVDVVLVPAITALSKWMKDNQDVVLAIVAVFTTYRLATMGVTAATKIAGAATKIWTGIQKAFNMVMNANPFVRVATLIAALAAAVVLAYQKSETFRKIVQGAWNGIKSVVTSVWNFLKGVFDAMQTAFKAVGDAAMWLWDNAIKPAWDAISKAAQILAQVILTVLIAPVLIAWELLMAGVRLWWDNVGKPTFDAIASVAKWLWESVLKPTWGFIQAAWKALLDGIKFVWTSVLKPAWDAVAAAAKWMWDNALKPAFGFIEQGWNNLLNNIKWVWESVLKPAWDAVASAATWLWDNVLKPVFSSIQSAWEGVGSGIKWVWENLISPAWEALKSGIGTVRDVFQSVTDTIANIWQGVKDAIREPVQFVVDVVWNNGILKAWNTIRSIWGGDPVDEVKFATGGVMPGYTPGKDVHRFFSPTAGFLNLSGGEAVMRPEFTKAMGPGWVHEMNKIARTSGVGGIKKAFEEHSLHTGGIYGSAPSQSFAGGGVLTIPDWVKPILPGWITDWLDKVNSSEHLEKAWHITTTTVSGVWNMIKKKIGEVWDDLVDELLYSSPVSGSVHKGTLLDPNLTDGLRKMGGLFGYDGRPGGKSLGSNYLSLFNAVKSVFPQARLTSGQRNTPDAHGRGKAADIGGPYPAPYGSQYMGHIKSWLYNRHKNSLYELIYNGIGNAVSNLKNSKHLAYNHATQMQHRNHVHAAVYDEGGMLGLGKTLVENRTGRPEAVLTPQQTQNLRDMVSGARYGDINVTLSLDDLEKIKTIEDFLGMLDRARTTRRQTERSGTVAN